MLAAALLILRPWEVGGGEKDEGPRAVVAFVPRAVDGDTIEAIIDGRGQYVRYIDMLSRVSRPTLRHPAAVTG